MPSKTPSPYKKPWSYTLTLACSLSKYLPEMLILSDIAGTGGKTADFADGIELTSRAIRVLLTNSSLLLAAGRREHSRTRRSQQCQATFTPSHSARRNERFVCI